MSGITNIPTMARWGSRFVPAGGKASRISSPIYRAFTAAIIARAAVSRNSAAMDLACPLGQWSFARPSADINAPAPGSVSDVDGNSESRKGTISVFYGPPPQIVACKKVEEERDDASDEPAVRPGGPEKSSCSPDRPLLGGSERTAVRRNRRSPVLSSSIPGRRGILIRAPPH